MAKSNVRVSVNSTGTRRIEAMAAKALAQAADATLTDIVDAQVVPFDTGTMQNDQTFADLTAVKQGVARVVTSAPQARRLYFHPEYDFQTVNNPNARGGWFADWIHGSKKGFARNAYAKFLKQFMGG